MGKKSSFFGKSTGNEVAQSTGGGVVSHIVQGKAYFTSYSMDVTVEGEEAPRHLDMMTHNHMAQSPPNAAMGTNLAMMDVAMMPAASPAPANRKEDEDTVEVFVDQAKGQAARGMDSVQLVSADGAYDKTLPLSAATPKGGLLSLKFEKVLPGKFYSLYWSLAGVKTPFWENVAFAAIRVHEPGAERARDDEDEDEDEDEDAKSASEDGEAEDADHPDEWFEDRPFGKKK
jgi:hypothetical protein